MHIQHIFKKKKFLRRMERQEGYLFRVRAILHILFFWGDDFARWYDEAGYWPSVFVFRGSFLWNGESVIRSRRRPCRGTVPSSLEYVSDDFYWSSCDERWMNLERQRLHGGAGKREHSRYAFERELCCVTSLVTVQFTFLTSRRGVCSGLR